jgi:cyclophilin family peptidyl-prolyl cis-trans isomerase
MRHKHFLSFFMKAFQGWQPAKMWLMAMVLGIGFYAIPHNATAQAKKSKKDFLITVSTDLGDIYLILFDETPLHKANFVKLAQSGFYDSTTFHRVLKDFVIQGGDPHSKPGNIGDIGMGGPGYQIDAEIVSGFQHERGTLAAARKNDSLNPEKQSSGSQFYIVQADEGAPHLDGKYSIFGRVIKGLDVVDAIAEVKVGANGLPEVPVYMKVKATLLKKKAISKIYGYSFNP